jgi:4a-hydroxytetrahydrobiopterin dehydratase
VRVVTARLWPMSTAIEPDALASATCMPADASTPALDTDEIERLSAGLDQAWRVEDGRLTREYRFSTFGAAFGLATRIALLAEAQGHHPTMEIAWGRLVVTWQTDAIGALSVNDMIMAAKVDRLVARGLGVKDG